LNEFVRRTKIYNVLLYNYKNYAAF
jgi:hypothetical protein